MAFVLKTYLQIPVYRAGSARRQFVTNPGDNRYTVGCHSVSIPLQIPVYRAVSNFCLPPVGGGALDAPRRQMLRFRIGFRRIRTLYRRVDVVIDPYIPFSKTAREIGIYRIKSRR